MIDGAPPGAYEMQDREKCSYSSRIPLRYVIPLSDYLIDRVHSTDRIPIILLYLVLLYNHPPLTVVALLP